MKSTEVIMESADGKTQTEVHNNESVALMEQQGWKVVKGKPVSKEELERRQREAGAEEVRQKEQRDQAEADEAARLKQAGAQGAAGATDGTSGASADASGGSSQGSGSQAPQGPDYSGMTKADLMELLDAKKVKYNERASKAGLIDALNASGKKTK